MSRANTTGGKTGIQGPYHYTQCGLDYVYLLNGYKIDRTPYGPGVSIQNVEGLHHAIAEFLVWNKALLGGKEVRFLRKLLDLTQVELGVFLGCSHQSVARWEKGQSEVNGAADKMIRFLYLGSQCIQVDVLQMVRDVVKLDAKLKDRQEFRETEDGWRAAA